MPQVILWTGVMAAFVFSIGFNSLMSIAQLGEDRLVCVCACNMTGQVHGYALTNMSTD